MSHNPTIPDEPGQLDLINDQLKSLLDCLEQANALEDDIQFPRLIAELQTVGAFTPEVFHKLSEEMDCEIEYIYELIDRACDKWDNIKEQTRQ